MDPLQQRAEDGDLDAMAEYGHRLIRGRGVPKNRPAGVRWLRRAADGLHTGAMYNLGRALLSGQGTRRDPREARAWLETASDQGDVRAASLLAHAALGLKPAGARDGDIPRDPASLRRYLDRAAELGDIGAALTLGQRTMRDPDASPDDLLRAKRWLWIAVDANPDHFAKALVELEEITLRDALPAALLHRINALPNLLADALIQISWEPDTAWALTHTPPRLTRLAWDASSDLNALRTSAEHQSQGPPHFTPTRIFTRPTLRTAHLDLTPNEAEALHAQLHTLAHAPPDPNAWVTIADGARFQLRLHTPSPSDHSGDLDHTTLGAEIHALLSRIPNPLDVHPTTQENTP